MEGKNVVIVGFSYVENSKIIENQVLNRSRIVFNRKWKVVKLREFIL
jgi:hypothetical protein